MKVKCINKDGNLLLTLGKIYTVFHEYRHFYEIENDATYKCTYNKSLFEIVEIVEETQPITPDNIEEVLKYNGFKQDQHENYIYNRIYKNNLLQVEVQEWSAYVLDSICDQERIFTIYFDEFLSFVQKRIELKPLPVEEEDTNYWDIEGERTYAKDSKIQHDGFYYFLNSGLKELYGIPGISIAPLQYQGKESDFTILYGDGTTKRAIWKGKK